MEAYAPTDNVSELTARVNDDGWASCFVNWPKGSRLRVGDAVLVFFRRWRHSGKGTSAATFFTPCGTPRTPAPDSLQPVILVALRKH